MSTTLNQFLGDKPRLEVATKNFSFHKKLRRLVAEEINKIHASTAKPDLASKVIKELAKPLNLKYLFGDNYVRNTSASDLVVYDHLEESVILTCEKFTGVTQQSKFEADLMWRLSLKSCPDKKMADGNPLVLLSDMADKNRVYVLDPKVEVAIVDGISPALLLDKDVKDRSKFQAPREVCLVRVNEMKSLLLFHDFSSGVQRRFLIPNDKTKNFKFKPLHEGFIQKGLQLAHREMTGEEFDLDTHGELKVNKRYLGKPLEVYVLDFTNRGRIGMSTPYPTEASYG